MAKVQKIEKKTHAYILEDGTVVRAISEVHVAEYQKDKKTVYSCSATKTVDGNKVETENFYVKIEDFVKKNKVRLSLKDRLGAAIANKDISTMTASELLALANIDLS
jgi:hypothetical protein